MSIISTDILHYLSIKTGSAGFTLTSTPANALGGYISTTQIDNVTLPNNLWADLSAVDNAAGKTDYRCRFVLNNHATLTLKNAVAFISGQTSGGADIFIATDNLAVSAKGAAPLQAATIANETTAPSGVSAFSQPTTAGTGLALGDLAPGQVKAIWEKRVLVANTPSVNPDGVLITVHGDTA